ncbi:MAG: LemA family protein [Actinomycetaceae bacterium]|nr:LemA family protein [Actinomycetaceae bacterium]
MNWSETMDSSAIVLIVILVFVLIFVMWLIGTYNRFVRLRNVVQESWRQIDVELNRRHSLIPNLVETVKGYMAHEQSTLQAVVEARRLAEAPATNLAERAQKEGALAGALSRLFAVSEAYPNLKADSTFLELQRELTNTEDRIAAGRRFYNSNVRNLNTLREAFPSSIVGAMFGFQKAEYFEVVDEAVRATPQVSFGFAGGQAGAAQAAGMYAAPGTQAPAGPQGGYVPGGQAPGAQVPGGQAGYPQAGQAGYPQGAPGQQQGGYPQGGQAPGPGQGGQQAPGEGSPGYPGQPGA